METYRRVNTVKVSFDRSIARPTALEIHRWVTNVLHLGADQIEALQLVGPENAVYIKLITKSLYEKVLIQHQGTSQATLAGGITTNITLEPADIDTINVRIFNLPPELPNEKIRQVLCAFGTVYQVNNETWSAGYDHRVSNGVRQVKMSISKVIPSNLTVCGKKAYVTYIGQEPTCFLCNSTSHLKQDCPTKMTHLGSVPSKRRMLSDLFKPVTAPPATTSNAPDVDAEIAEISSAIVDAVSARKPVDRKASRTDDLDTDCQPACKKQNIDKEPTPSSDNIPEQPTPATHVLHCQREDENPAMEITNSLDTHVTDQISPPERDISQDPVASSQPMDHDAQQFSQTISKESVVSTSDNNTNDLDQVQTPEHNISMTPLECSQAIDFSDLQHPQTIPGSSIASTHTTAENTLAFGIGRILKSRIEPPLTSKSRHKHIPSSNSGPKNNET